MTFNMSAANQRLCAISLVMAASAPSTRRGTKRYLTKLAKKFVGDTAPQIHLKPGQRALVAQTLALMAGALGRPQENEAPEDRDKRETQAMEMMNLAGRLIDGKN